jgi:hypothetical protein
LPGVLAFARKEPSAVLLFTQLAALLVYPAMEGNDVGRSLFSVLGIALLGLVVLASAARRRGRGWACCSPRRRACCSSPRR